MNRVGLFQKVQISSYHGTSVVHRTSFQGVSRLHLLLGLRLNTGLMLRLAAYKSYSNGSSGLKLQFLGRRACNLHFGTHYCNWSKDYLVRTNQKCGNFMCASPSFSKVCSKEANWTNVICRFTSNSYVEAAHYCIFKSGERFYHSHSEGPGLEVYPSTFNSSEKTRKFVKKLRQKQRVLLMNELQILNQELNKDAAVEDQSLLLPPSKEQLRLVLLNNAVPFVGFGFLDNAIMIAAGEYIDWKIGAALHISTLAAAGFGNLISDLAGVVLAGYVEAFAARVGIPTPNLSVEQFEMKQTKLASSLGRCVGIAIGCLLGMFPLLFLNTDRDEDESKEEEAKDIVAES